MEKRKLNNSYLKMATGFTLSTLTIPLLNSVDTAVVGRLESPVYIGGVALGGTVFNTIYWILGFLRVSTSGYSAKAYGMKAEKEEALALVRPLIVSVVMGLLFFIFQDVILQIALRFYKADNHILHYMTVYYKILIWGAPFVLLNYTFLGWIMGRRQIRECLILQLVTNITNIILDLYFVESLGMDVAGVAYATLISQIMTTILSIIIILKGKKDNPLKIISAIRKIDFKKIFDRQTIKQIGGVNSDLVIRTVCLLTVTNLFMEEASREGEIMLAANSILFQIQYLMSYFFDGFANASSVFAGNGVGERKVEKVEWTIKKSFHICIMNAIVLFSVFTVFRTGLISLYTTNNKVINIANAHSFWLMIFPAVINAGLIFYGVFTGVTYTAPIRNSMIFSLVLFFMGYFIFIPLYGNHGLWFSFILFSFGRSIFLLMCMKKLRKRVYSEIRNENLINKMSVNENR